MDEVSKNEQQERRMVVLKLPFIKQTCELAVSTMNTMPIALEDFILSKLSQYEFHMMMVIAC